MQKVGWVGLISIWIVLLTGFLQGNQMRGVDTGVMDLPTTYDLRALDYPFPVINQQSCELSFASTSTEAFQAAEWQFSDAVNEFSINQAKECTWERVNETADPCSDGDIAQVMNLFSTMGVVDEFCNPLVLGPSSCVESCTPLYTLTSWKRLSTYETAAPEKIKQAVLEYGPVITRINTTMDGYTFYDGSGVLYDADVFTTTNHTILIVGWDDTLHHAGGSGAWLVKDSHGTDWGEDGFAWVAYGSGGIGINSSVISQWKPYDEREHLYYYDQSWELSPMALNGGDKDAYMMVLFTTERAEILEQIHVWSNDAATLSVWVYDRFENGQLYDLLFAAENVWLPTAGVHTIEVEEIIGLDAMDQVAVVAYLNNQTRYFPLAVDVESSFAVGKNWYSDDGITWTAFQEGLFHGNFGLRMRTTLPDPPQAPAGFSIETLSQTSLRLSWQGNNQNILGYVLERFNQEMEQWERITSLDEGTLYFTDTNLLDDRDYFYRLFAYNLGGLSPPVLANGHTLPYPPSAPENFLITEIFYTQLTLSWLDTSANETGFILERQKEGQDWESLVTLSANTCQWKDNHVIPGKSYRYRLSAVNAGGESDPLLSDWVDVPSLPFSLFLPLILH